MAKSRLSLTNETRTEPNPKNNSPKAEIIRTKSGQRPGLNVNGTRTKAKAKSRINDMV